MQPVKNNIIKQLEKEILGLQGFKPLPAGTAVTFGLDAMENAFPQGVFPLAAIHEFISAGMETSAATIGFVGGLLSSLMQQSGGACVWINVSGKIFPPALKTFGIDPARIIFIHLKNEKELCWVMEEALKCKGLAAVVGEMQLLSFTASRRLQLAVEHSRVTGFVLRNLRGNSNTTACVSRWKITPVASSFDGDLSVVGFPRWQVELLKIRNGKPGTWLLEWAAGRFRSVPVVVPSLEKPLQRKTG